MIQENENLNPFEKKNAFALIKAKFYDYVININIPYDSENIGLPFEPCLGFYFVDVDNQFKTIYNCNTDFSKNKEGYIFEGIDVLTF